jgi:hypothetical protein
MPVTPRPLRWRLQRPRPKFKEVFAPLFSKSGFLLNLASAYRAKKRFTS